MFCHVPPASVDLNTPVPAKELRAMCGSPVPTQTKFGFLSDTVTTEIEEVDSFSKIGFQVVPLLMDFHRLPDPDPQ
jgi:hypothetical protein